MYSKYLKFILGYCEIYTEAKLKVSYNRYNADVLNKIIEAIETKAQAATKK